GAFPCHRAAIDKSIDTIQDDELRLKRCIDLSDHFALMRRTVEFAHVIESMPGSRNDSDMQFERHGKYAAVLVSFQTACGNQALGFEDGAGYSEPIGPMTVFGPKLDPVRFFQVIEAD